VASGLCDGVRARRKAAIAQFGDDVILAERRLVALDPERTQPSRNVRYRPLGRRAASKNDAIGADLSKVRPGVRG
jgi:hypothetical protein